MQNQGSIGPATVAELLQTMQQERATGTLQLASNGNQCSLHFLFGHLFHAVGGGGEGESAVIAVLGWQDGEYNFNPRAKLPPEETINSSTEDLLAVWRTGTGPRRTTVNAPGEVKVAVNGSVAPARPPAPVEQRSETDDWLESVRQDQGEGELADIPAFHAAPAKAPSKVAAPTRPFSVAAVLPQPAPAPAAAPAQHVDWPAARTAQQPAVEKPRPAPASRPAPQVSRAVPGNSRAQLALVIPMPSGPALHTGLKASFLNFPMLLKTLGQDGFSGYISVRGEKDPGSIAHILFREGQVLQAQQRSGGSYRRSKTALQEVLRTVSAGDGLIDAIQLPGDLVTSLGGLVVANTVLYQLPSRIVDFDALLEFVDDQSLIGGILVSSGSGQVSVVLLSEGRSKASFSSASPELAEGAGAGTAATSDREARIDVVSSPDGPLPVIELSDIG